ncbi:MAG: hypothetical protein M3436_15120 [Pseudomonadota bacterium]|nr:hypothetical protein [Pseudomonadota bacterium]
MTDLRIGHERGVFPVYFDPLPTSETVAVCGGVQITIPSKRLSVGCPAAATKWSRALLKLTKNQRDGAGVSFGTLESRLLDRECRNDPVDDLQDRREQPGM